MIYQHLTFSKMKILVFNQIPSDQKLFRLLAWGLQYFVRTASGVVFTDVNYLYLVNDYDVKKIFQSVEFLWIFDSSGCLFRVLVDCATDSQRGLRDLRWFDRVALLLSGFVMSDWGFNCDSS